MTKATNDLAADRERHLRHAVDAARHIADIAGLSAETLDTDRGFPADEIRALADQGLHRAFAAAVRRRRTLGRASRRRGARQSASAIGGWKPRVGTALRGAR